MCIRDSCLSTPRRPSPRPASAGLGDATASYPLRLGQREQLGLAGADVDYGRGARGEEDAGRAEVVVGPAKKRLLGDQIEFMREYIADAIRYLVIVDKEGNTEHIPGPANVWFDPTKHRSIAVKRCIMLDANEHIVSYLRTESNITRRVVTGRVSADAAKQRAGRAGRVRAGTCWRLWCAVEQEALEVARPPEMATLPLCGVALRAKSLFGGAVAPLLAAWAEGMRRAILANRTIRHDQPSLAAALNTTRGVKVLRFSEANVCRVCRADKEGHCASTCAADSCWVDHRDWGPNYNKAGIDGIAKVDGGTKVSKKWRVPPG